MQQHSLRLEFNDGPFFYAREDGESSENSWYFCYGDYDRPDTVRVLAHRVVSAEQSHQGARASKPKVMKMAELRALFAADRDAFIGKAMRDGAPDFMLLLRKGSTEKSPPLAAVPVALSEALASVNKPCSLGELVKRIERSNGGEVATQGGEGYVLKLGSQKCAISSLQTFASLTSLYHAPPFHWIASMLDPAILSGDAHVWRAPNPWEIRHVVGEHSLIGVSSVKTAEMLGITPPNFRKYMASGSAKNRHAIGFSTWHLLLHFFGVKQFSQNAI